MIITYSSKSKKFVIKASFAESASIADLPNKRFQRRSGVWHVPPLSRNSEILLDRFRADMSEEAIEVAEKSVSRVRPKYEKFPTWYTFKTEPFKHQREGLDFMWGLERGALFMEMGTGKSKVAVDINAARFMAGQHDSWVVFCPNSIRDNWVEELAVHSPLQDIPVIVVGDLTPAKSKRLIAEAEGAERFVAIVGLESLQSKFRGGAAYDTLIGMIGGRKFSATVDESHLVKNHAANRSKNVEYICSAAVTVCIMTGSPTSQGLLDLYMQFQILDPNIIGVGDFFSFRNRYAEMGGYEGREVVGYRNVEELMSLLKPFVFQRTKEETLDLPDKLYAKRVVEMTKEQARVYKALDKETEAAISDLARGGASVALVVDQVLAKYNALQQITGGFANYDDYSEDGLERIRRSAWVVEPKNNPKIKELIAIAGENPGKQVIVWAKFRNEIAQIVEALEGVYGPGSVAEYHGGITTTDRRANMGRFKAGTARFFVANQQTGGTGLTINEASLVVYFSNSLKLTDRLQSEDRCHRIGQKNDVLYIDLVCRGTKDVDVLTAIKEKRSVAEYVRDQMRRDD